MRPSSKLTPLLILGAAVLVIALLYMARRTPEDRPQPDSSPLVRVVPAHPTDYRFEVTAHGSVSPQTESDLVPQVSGEIIMMSPALAAGGFFDRGEVLAKIDDADYRVDREAARAQVARARSEYTRSEKDLARQSRLADRSVASESRIDDAKNAYRIAEASLREAEARLERANRDLARTEIRAPYRGRVRSEQVDLGQFVTRGTAIARIYGVDYAEVRLPLPDRELAFLDVPLIPEPASQPPTLEDTPPTPSAQPADDATTLTTSIPETSGARVLFEADFAGERHQWQGHLVRTEAELDPRSRMVHVVARVRDPFGLETPRSAPLAIGLFVDATIEGAMIEDATLLPRDALRGAGQVYLVDENDEIEFRRVTVRRIERERIVVTDGLEPGDRILTSPLDAAIAGMRVRVVEESATESAATQRATEVTLK